MCVYFNNLTCVLRLSVSQTSKRPSPSPPLRGTTAVPVETAQVEEGDPQRAEQREPCRCIAASTEAPWRSRMFVTPTSKKTLVVPHRSSNNNKCTEWTKAMLECRHFSHRRTSRPYMDNKNLIDQ